MRKIYPLGHKTSIKLLSSKGKHTSSSQAKIITFSGDKSNIILEHGIHLAFAISKKRFSKAVDRNRIKRRFRGSVQKVTKNINCEKITILMLIIPKTEITTASFEEITALVSKSLEKTQC